MINILFSNDFNIFSYQYFLNMFKTFNYIHIIIQIDDQKSKISVYPFLYSFSFMHQFFLFLLSFCLSPPKSAVTFYSKAVLGLNLFSVFS